MQPPAFFYKPDGSGRDSYILSSHGGFIHKYNEYGGAKAFYDNSLRSYAPIILRNSSSVLKSPVMAPAKYLKA